MDSAPQYCRKRICTQETRSEIKICKIITDDDDDDDDDDDVIYVSLSNIT